MRFGLLSLFLIFLSINAIYAQDEQISFPPSIAPIRTVLLSYLREEKDPRDKFGDPRLDLIREIRKTFPKLDIRVTSTLSKDRLFEKYPDLKSTVSQVVQIKMNSIQDPYEFGWDRGEQLQLIQFPYAESKTMAPLFPEAKNTTPLPSAGKTAAGKMHFTHPSGTASRTAGGNVEFLPDGTPITGLNLPQDAVEFLSRTSGKEVLQVDTSWNSSHDLDEVFLWTIDPTKKARCILFYLDVKGAKALLTKDNLDEYVNTEVSVLKKLYAALGVIIDPATEKKMKSDLAEGNAALLSVLGRLNELQDVIDEEVSKIIAHPGMKDCRKVALPVVYADSSNPNDGFGMQFENQINSLVIEYHVFTLRSRLPAQQRAIEDIFKKNGFSVHSFDSHGFDGGGGNMHCSTNTIRNLR